MSKDTETGAVVIGCLGAAIYLLVCIPLWLFLLYQILLAIDASTHVWVAYWVYLPMLLLSGCVVHAAKAMFETKG